MIRFHAAIIFISYAAFLVAVLTGIAFLIQERWLKRKDSRVLSSPMISLEMLDQMNRWAVGIGFALFSFGVAQGLFLARANWGASWTWDPKEVWSLLTWAAYAVVLALRATVGLRGRRVVWMSVMSFVLVMFTFVGVNYFIGGRHVFF